MKRLQWRLAGLASAAALLACAPEWSAMNMNTEAATAPARFALKAPAHYFSDPRALALLDAVLKGQVAAAQAALAAGAPVDAEGPASNPDNRLRLLHYAVAAAKPEAARLLVELGAPLDLRDEAGYTPLMRAINALDVPMAQALLARGASLQPEAVNGATAPNQVQALWLRAAAGSPLHADLAQLKTAMQGRGINFPVPTAQEVRAARQPR